MGSNLPASPLQAEGDEAGRRVVGRERRGDLVLFNYPSALLEAYERIVFTSSAGWGWSRQRSE